MRAGTIPLLLILIILAVPAQALSGAAPGNPSSDGPAVQGTSGILWLKAGAFDPLSDPVPGPAWLHRPSTHPYYVVQFDGPVLPSWREEAEALGVEFLQYLPENSFFSRVPRDSIDDLEEVEHVRYVGPIHPAYRIHPLLFDDLRLSSTMDLDILLWDPAQARTVASLVMADGGSVVRVDWDVVTVNVRLSAVPSLVAHDSLGIRWVEPYLPPTLLNDNDARTVNARQSTDGTYVSDGSALWSYNPTTDEFEGYTGKNVTVTVADTGLDETHPGFQDRIVYYYDYGNDGEGDTNGHGTHVSGTVLGDGSWRSSDVGQDGKYAGVAPEAELIIQEVFVAGNPGSNGMGRDAESEGATISSNSWISGYFGDYNGQCEAYDRLTHDANNVKPGAQPIFYVFGAGNDGRGGIGTIRPPSLAKNVLSVGSTGNDKWGSSSNTMSAFSSQGPAEDGRLKPDIVLPGHMLASSRSIDPGAHGGWGKPADGQNSYVFGSGTSMATPGAAGSAAVVTQFMREEFDHEPSPALLKAILINGATPLAGYEYPGMQQGWGRIDLDRSLLETTTYKVYREDQEYALDMTPGSDEISYWFLVRTGEPLKITLTWSDVPGMVNSEKHLVNDLDLAIVDPVGNKYSGNNFTEGETEALDDYNHDRVNNVEGILVEDPTEGLWNLRVKAYDVPSGDQAYALVVSGNVEKGHVDLKPEDLAADPGSVEEGHVVSLSARVRNVGNREAADVVYRLEQEDPSGGITVIEEVSIGKMVPAGSVRLDWTATGVRGGHTFRLIVDPGTTVLESDEVNNILELPYFFRGYDVALTATKTEVTADPGELVTFDLTLKNGGNVPDEFSLDMTDPPPGWQSGFVKDVHSVKEGDTTKVVLDVLVPLNATAGEQATFLATAVSSGNGTKVSSIRVNVEVNQVYSMEVAAVSGEQMMLPGEDRTLTLMLRNTGNGEDTFTLSLPEELSGGWWVQLTQPIVNVPLRSETNVEVVLTSPVPALAGTSVEFKMAVSSSMPGLSKNVSFSAVIVQFYDTQVTILNRISSGDTGDTVIIPMTIENLGNGPVTYNGDINFPDGSWTGGLDMANTTLAGYSETRANLTFSVPVDAINDSYDFTMVVISSGGEVIFYNFTFAVHQFHDLVVTITSETPTVTQGQQTWVRLVLDNRGNGLEDVSMTADIPSTWTFDFSTQYPTIDPFSEVILDLLLNTEVNTPGGPYDVEVIAYYGPSKTEDERVTATMNVLTRPDLTVVAETLNISEENPYVDTLVRITAQIMNLGQTEARDVFIQLYVDDYPVGQPHYLSGIDPDDVETLTFLWTTNASGLREVRVVVDFQDDISEPDEGNNAASMMIEVSKVDLKTSPGITSIVALVAIASATAVAWNGRRQGRRSQE
jgi:uncharacterized membrane protein/subtilisin family serine protease